MFFLVPQDMWVTVQGNGLPGRHSGEKKLRTAGGEDQRGNESITTKNNVFFFRRGSRKRKVIERHFV